jgi:hypothetical protein
MQSSWIVGLGDGGKCAHIDFHGRSTFCRYRTISCSLRQTGVLPVGRFGEWSHDTEVGLI